MREERKDWISTSDVLNWLRNIEDSLKYDMPEVVEPKAPLSGSPAPTVLDRG